MSWSFLKSGFLFFASRCAARIDASINAHFLQRLRFAIVSLIHVWGGYQRTACRKKRLSMR